MATFSENVFLVKTREIDYYGILELMKCANDLEIIKAFKRLAISHHPKTWRPKNEQVKTGIRTFALIAEAYDVLSDPLKRAIYDQYGEYGLKKGVPIPGGFWQPYKFHGDPIKTFTEFFGTDSPYPHLRDVIYPRLAEYNLPMSKGIKTTRNEPIVKQLHLSLKEIFFGGVKKMKIHKNVKHENYIIEEIDEILTIPIKPGILTGTRFVFPEKGDFDPESLPADVVFVVADKKHETFWREGFDLHAIFEICLKDALTGTSITIDTIDDRKLYVMLSDVISPDYKKIIIDEGMPRPDNRYSRGNLILHFNLKFPVYFPSVSRNRIRSAFEGYESNDDKTDRSDDKFSHTKMDIDVSIRRTSINKF